MGKFNMTLEFFGIQFIGVTQNYANNFMTRQGQIHLSLDTLADLSQFFSICCDLKFIRAPSQALEIILDMQSQRSSQKRARKKIACIVFFGSDGPIQFIHCKKKKKKTTTWQAPHLINAKHNIVSGFGNFLHKIPNYLGAESTNTHGNRP